MKHILVLLVIMIMGAGGLCGKVIVVESPYTPVVEEDSLVNTIRRGGCDVECVPLRTLSLKGMKGLRGVDAVVYHRTDTCPFSSDELKLKDMLLRYVKDGGNLLLTMDGVRLLHAWGVEPGDLTVENQPAFDQGYGRALGFHAYRSHPLFENLSGGAYVWKGKYDHYDRTIGFSGDCLPLAPGSKVIGINWAYIHYHENRKLIWETPYGKGKILAIGAYLHFSEPNVNKTTLDIFTKNTIDYLRGGRRFESNPGFWTYTSERTRHESLPVKGVSVQGRANDVPAPVALRIDRASDRRHFWNVSGRRAMAAGREKGGIEEVWIHPVMALRDLSIGLKMKNMDKVVWLDNCDSKITKCPEYVSRKYNVGNGVFTEVYAVSPVEPVVMLDCDWTGADIDSVYVAYTSTLRLMWPYSHESSGTLVYDIAEGGKVSAVSSPTGNLAMLTVFSESPSRSECGEYDFSHKDTSRFSSVPAKDKQVAFLHGFDARCGKMSMFIAGGEEGLEKTASLFKNGISADRLYAGLTAVTAGIDDRYLTIESSDAEFNEAYRWAMVSTDKFFCHTPSIGSSLMAGYWSTSRGWNGGHAVSGRPGYAWYFGRDTEWTGTALTAYGDFDKVREILTTFGRFQDPDGKVYHELTTSGSAHYDAADATPLYLVLAGDYLRRSGDLDFIRKEWRNISRALSYCRSTDTDGDGLIENTAVGHGWQESHQLHGAHTEVYLAAIWAKALEECGYMANALGLADMSTECNEDARKVRDIIDTRFWNPNLDFYNHGLMRDGSFQTEKCLLGGTPVVLGIADPVKGEKTALNFSSRYYSTDWGVTLVGYDSPYYATGGYNYGNIWPFHNGCAAMAEYRAGLPSHGYRHLMEALRQYSLWDGGNIAEVVSGDKLAFTGICPHQQWSSGMNLKPLYDGMLGFESDALAGKMKLMPCFPLEWEHADVAHIPLGDNRFALNYRRHDDVYVFELAPEGNSRALTSFGALLPAATTVDKVFVDGVKTEFTCESGKRNVAVRIPDMKISKQCRIEMKTRGGIGLHSNLTPLVDGMGNDGLKIEDEWLDAEKGEYVVQLAGRPGRSYLFDVFAKSGIAKCDGAEVQQLDGDVARLNVSFSDGKDPFEGKIVRIKLNQ